MQTILTVITLALAIAMGIPPQVKELAHTYKSTDLTFWYPTFFKKNGEVVFSRRLSVLSTSTDTDWTVDSLRSSHFICGKEFCRNTPNLVAREWQKNEETIAALQKELSEYQQRVTDATSRKAQAEQGFQLGSCEQVTTAPKKPRFACADYEAKEVALITCAIRELGTKACEKSGKGALDSDAPEFLKAVVAREGCAAVVHEVTGQQYNLLDKTVKKYTEELGITLFSEFLGWISPDIKEGFDWTIALAKTDACIPSGIRLCRAKYNSWQADLTSHFSNYGQEIRRCQELGATAQAATDEISLYRIYVGSSSRHLSAAQTQKTMLEERLDAKDISHAIKVP